LDLRALGLVNTLASSHVLTLELNMAVILAGLSRAEGVVLPLKLVPVDFHYSSTKSIENRDWELGILAVIKFNGEIAGSAIRVVKLEATSDTIVPGGIRFGAIRGQDRNDVSGIRQNRSAL
jgi:hypothetical protein